MDRKLGRLIFACFLAVSGHVAAEEITSKSDSELCVDREAFAILGGAFEGYSQDAYESEIARRQLSCEPRSFYADMARQTIRNIVQATMYDQVAQQPSQPPQRSWSQRMGDAGRAYLQMQQQQQERQRANAPRTTDCYNTAAGVTCTTR